jgi:hypothetical protein
MTWNQYDAMRVLFDKTTTSLVRGVQRPFTRRPPTRQRWQIKLDDMGPIGRPHDGVFAIRPRHSAVGSTSIDRGNLGGQSWHRLRLADRQHDASTSGLHGDV